MGDNFTKNIFLYFEPFWPRLASKFENSANKRQKSILKISVWESNWAEFYADLRVKTGEKFAKTFT
jgi:hypothetical protein